MLRIGVAISEGESSALRRGLSSNAKVYLGEVTASTSKRGRFSPATAVFL
jgi:hypothetical protein